MATLFDDTFTYALSSSQFLPLEGLAVSGTVWERVPTAGVPNQILIGSLGTAFRSAYNPALGADCGNGSEHYLNIAGLPANYVIEAVIKFQDQYIEDGSQTPLDEPNGSPPSRSINRSGIDNNPAAGPESIVRLQGRWTNNYQGYQLSYRASSGIWKLTKCTGQTESGGADLPFGIDKPTGVSTVGNSILQQAAQQSAQTTVVYQSLGESAPIGVTLPADSQVGDYDYVDGGIVLGRHDQPLSDGQSVTARLAFDGSRIYAQIDSGSGFVTVMQAFDLQYTGTGAGEDNLVGLRFDGGSSPVAGLHVSSFKVHTDPTGGPTENLVAPVISGSSKAGVNRIIWNLVAGASSYDVYRGSSCGTSLALIGTATTGDYSDALATSGTYAYVVVARANGSTSPKSNCVTLTSFAGAAEAGEKVWRWAPRDEQDDRGSVRCAICFRWCPGRKAARVDGKGYCYDHAPREGRRI